MLGGSIVAHGDAEDTGGGEDRGVVGLVILRDVAVAQTYGWRRTAQGAQGRGLRGPGVGTNVGWAHLLGSTFCTL